ncbi:hypothetical protein Leryth_021746 [Lithospermum erythrorhizon]|nr:hypothetical protein Leryth_021746 [Lithospermum erythrorhizon]
MWSTHHGHPMRLGCRSELKNLREETQGYTASVQIHASGKDLQIQPIARRSFFRCSIVQMSWNNGSTELLIVVQADDKTNQSYYGESKLNYLTRDGSHDGLVPLHWFY